LSTEKRPVKREKHNMFVRLLSLLCLCWAGVMFVVAQDTYPHQLGPFELQQYPYYTLGPNLLTGRVWLRINDGFNKIQFMYQLDQDPTTTAYWPFFAMHLHYGEVKAGNKSGPIVITIRGKGNITGYSWPESPLPDTICSDSCLPGALGCNLNCPPNQTVPFTFAYAYACPGGCDHDARDGDGNRTLAPSRYCDLDNDNPSNPPQNTWMSGRYSDERSGNTSDTGYSPYSIFILDNFQYWCNYSIDFLPTLFEPGAFTYVALHSNYNDTGLPDLVYGTLLAIVNNGTGIDVLAATSPASPIPISHLLWVFVIACSLLLTLMGDYKL